MNPTDATLFWYIQDGIQDGRQLGSLDLYDQHIRSKAF